VNQTLATRIVRIFDAELERLRECGAVIFIEPARRTEAGIA
jgi:hypothetical protein